MTALDPEAIELDGYVSVDLTRLHDIVLQQLLAVAEDDGVGANVAF